MSVIVVTRLRELVSANGVEVVRDHRRCEALVRDFCGSDIRECNLLLQGLRQDIPASLLEDCGRMPASQSISRLIGRLTNNLGMTPEAARWVVVSWGFALGLLKQTAPLVVPNSHPNIPGVDVSSPEKSVRQPTLSVNQATGSVQNNAPAIPQGKASKRNVAIIGGGTGIGSAMTGRVFLFVYRMLGGIVAVGALGLLIYSMRTDEKPNPDPVQVVVGLPGNSRGVNGQGVNSIGSGLGENVENDAEISGSVMNRGKSEKIGVSNTDGKMDSNIIMQKKDSIGPNNSPIEWPKQITNSIGIKLVRIPKGKFMMGSKNERLATLHEVTLTKDYYLSVYEVTQAEFEKIMGGNPSYWNKKKLGFDTGRFPVGSVTFDAAQDFCRKLSDTPEEKKIGRVYRLPTEAEWEYACRAGSTDSYCYGNDKSFLDQYAWYGNNSGKKYVDFEAIHNKSLKIQNSKEYFSLLDSNENRQHPVGEKKPNAWGLYDMHGNMNEWVSDFWGGDYPKNPQTDPKGPIGGNSRIYRGGCSSDWPSRCESSNRFLITPKQRYDQLGIRLALSISGNGN